MANKYLPNKLTDLIAVRAAESGAYLNAGARSYLADQLKPNMRNDSKEYTFVVKDAGRLFRKLQRSMFNRQIL